MKNLIAFKISAVCFLFTLLNITSVNAQMNEELARILHHKGMSEIKIPTETSVGENVAQTSDISDKDIKSDAIIRNLIYRQSNQRKNELHGLSGVTNDIQTHLPYAITVEEDEIWVDVMIKAESGYSGILRSTRARNVLDLGEIITASLPVSLMTEIKEHPMVEFLETSALRKAHNFNGKKSINADKVHSGENLPRPIRAMV
jgi:hypothetical protein